MKKSILLFTAVLTLAIHPVAAQDARQRTVETIVQDALALMPIQHQNDFNREMEDLAKAAPQSIQILAQMLQPAEKASNNLVEYALNGVATYASTHKQYREAVLNGFTMSAPRAADQYARQFLQEQMRYLTGEEDVVLAQHTGAAPYAEQYDKLLKLGDNAGNEVVKAVRSKDRAYRMQALKFATDHKLVNAMLAQKVAALYPIVPADAKVDILNWLGDNKVESQKTLLTRVAKLGGETADAALEALGHIGGDDVADVMIAQLGGKNNDAAASALRSYKGDLTVKIPEAIDKAQTKVPAAMKETNNKKLIALMGLANDRRIKTAYGLVKALCESTEPSVAQAAREALAGVVTPAQAAEMAQMLDKADANQVPALQKALFASVKAQEPKAQYNTLSGLMKQSTQKERFYPALAETGTDESVAELEQIWSANNQSAALNALKQSTNYKASQALFKAASAGDEDALDKYVDLVNANEQDVDSRCEKLTNAMNTARGTDLKKYILRSFGSTPTLPAFKLVSQYVGDQELG
ncbi:MAG: hypothetical protein HUJ99_05410, partial [Bacteroidaceae bacterium]|nr:hypothetical protein [Bacteroidaceae bacterium]